MDLVAQGCTRFCLEGWGGSSTSPSAATPLIAEAFCALTAVALPKRDLSRPAVFDASGCLTAEGDRMSCIGVGVPEARAVLGQDPLPEVMAESLRIRQVFSNPVGTAITYRRPDEPPRIDIVTDQLLVSAVEPRPPRAGRRGISARECCPPCSGSAFFSSHSVQRHPWIRIAGRWALVIHTEDTPCADSVGPRRPADRPTRLCIAPDNPAGPGR